MERGEVEGNADWTWANIKSRKSEYLREQKIQLADAQRRGARARPARRADRAGVRQDRRRPEAMDIFFSLKTVARPIMAAPDAPPN